MKWKLKEARYGDIVRVSLGSIYHFGIFVSEDEVIQFGLPPTTLNVNPVDVEVLSTPVGDFLAGGFLEVGCPEGREKKRRKTPEQTVAAARARLGERGYDIIYNNCEHFANECALGEKFSSMTDSLRAKFRAIPVVHVYAARFPFPVDDDKIAPAARAKETESCSNPAVREQKYYVWKLLEHALMRTFGLNIGKLNLRKLSSGKWECDECCFSLSHSGDVVAVAVSRKPVGVDIEKCDPSRFTPALADKILTDAEKKQSDGLSGNRGEWLNALWTKKEAIFKQSGASTFAPTQVDTDRHPTATKRLSAAGGEYFLSVASEDAAQAVFRVLGEAQFE